MRTLQAGVAVLVILALANSSGLARGHAGIRIDDQAITVAASLPGLGAAGSRAADTVGPIEVAWNCPPGYIPSRYYKHCVLARRLSHPTSTPSSEQLPGAAQRNAVACSQKGLLPGGDAGVANGDKCLCPPPFRSLTGGTFISSRSECGP